MARECRRCNRPAIRGVHFTISLVSEPHVRATYDVCQSCMQQHSPLIIPAGLRRGGTVQYSVKYEPFGRSGGDGA